MTSKTTGDVMLAVKGLRVVFHTYAGEVKALDGVDLEVRKGEILGLVGESGSGKSVTALSIENLLPPNAEVVEGEVLLDGVDLLKVKRKDLNYYRLKKIAMVFQDPSTYLNPVLTVGSQITEIMEGAPQLFTADMVESRLEDLRRLKAAGTITPKQEEELVRLSALPKDAKLSGREFDRLAKLHALDILRQVRLPEPERIFRSFPFELSGGMRQRAMIAMALLRKPEVFLADEITTAVDVTVQAQILKLLLELKHEIDASIILITHDLAVVAEVCDRVAVMYAGSIVEVAEVGELFSNPLHPYTKGLLASIPRPDSAGSGLKSIPGMVPNLIFPPTGCRFHPRCAFSFEECPKVKPPLTEVSKGHFVACLLFGSE